MGQLVETLAGLVDEDDLEVYETPAEMGDNYRKHYTVWKLKADHPSGHKAGTVVRQDAAASMLRGLGAVHEVGKLS